MATLHQSFHLGQIRRLFRKVLNELQTINVFRRLHISPSVTGNFLVITPSNGAVSQERRRLCDMNLFNPIVMKVDMEVIVTTEGIVESLQHMEDLIEGRFAENDLSRVTFAENRLSNLFESQMMAKGFRKFLLFCEPSSPLFVDELCHVLGKVDDFLIWAKSEIDIATKQL
ncbi:hypothetical protein [Acidovorax carolinensis]|uniref:hypothetical protein n=1 Tax=Acidovorax carolinensis TaxID=553814 RepID=UPI000B34A097|nr:hypothetical protein [Acidovorax carolinensis]ART48087.1 hypothetical protein CBP33_08065 [Acidovorax carolinensis]